MIRRTGRGVAALAALALLAAGCGEETVAGPEAAPAATDACAEGERPQLQAGSHLLGDTEPPVPYSSTPASSGWHDSGVPDTGVRAEPLDDPALVAVLEVGGVAAVYDPARLDPASLEALEATARDTFPDRLTVAPYDGDPGAPLVLAAWGVLQRCDDLDPDATAEFVLRYHGRTELDH